MMTVNPDICTVPPRLVAVPVFGVALKDVSPRKSIRKEYKNVPSDESSNSERQYLSRCKAQLQDQE